MDFNFITKKSNSIIIIFRVADDGYFIVLSPYVKGQKFFALAFSPKRFRQAIPPS